MKWAETPKETESLSIYGQGAGGPGEHPPRTHVVVFECICYLLTMTATTQSLQKRLRRIFFKEVQASAVIDEAIREEMAAKVARLTAKMCSSNEPG